MRFKIVIPIVIWIVLESAAASTSPHGSSLRKSTRTMPDTSLMESYELSKGLIPAERAILLNFLSRTAAQHRLPQTQAWADENLLIARELPMDWNRLAIEKNALVAMSYVNPGRSVALLRTLELPVADESDSFPEDVRSDAANVIFQNYWRANGRKGIVRLRSTATYLGQTGQYPYRGIAVIITKLTAEPQNRSQHLPEEARTLVLDAYSSYDRGSKFGIEDADFVEFLQTLHPIVAIPLLKEGLQLAVKRLLAANGAPAGKQIYIAHIQTEKGAAVFHDPRQQLLFSILPLVREVDPDWANQIIKDDPDMGQAEGNGGKLVTTEGAFTESAEQQNYALQQSRAQAAGEMAQRDPVRALQLAQTIFDTSLRTVALANVAQAAASPSRATQIEGLIGDAVPTIKDAQNRLQGLAALARASAVAGDMASFGDALTKCFSLGEELFEEDLISHPDLLTYTAPSYNILVEVVKAGVPVNAQTTASKVEQLRNVNLKAYLLEDLAESGYAVKQSHINPDKHPF